MSFGDFGFIPKIATSSINSSHPLALQGLNINPYADSLFSSKFKWEGVTALPTVSKAKQQMGPSRTQILEWYFLLKNNEQEGLKIVSKYQRPSFLLIVLLHFDFVII